MKSIEVTSILNKQKRRDDWFLTDYSVNPYSGCSINCTYCYTRGSKYGENLAESFSVKSNAVELLDRQLKRRALKKEYGYIAVGSATDSYVPIETKTLLTRRLLEIILKHRFPVALSTKSSLVRRDFDILKEIDSNAVLPPDLRQSPGRGTMLMTSMSSLDDALAATLEPGAATPGERLAVVRDAVAEGLFAGVAFLPLLPHLSDSDAHLDDMIRAAKTCRAQFVFVGGLTLFGNGAFDSKSLYLKFVESHSPHLLNDIRRRYSSSTSPPDSYESKLEARARELCRQHGVPFRIRHTTNST